MSLVIATAGGLSSVEASTGNQIKTYKQCESTPSGLALTIGDNGRPNSLLAVQIDKPLIHHYALRKEGVVKRIVLPIKAPAIAVSPDGLWLAAGSREGALYVWDLCSGSLKALHSEAHFQALTSLAWSKDSAVLVTGGQDARVLLWRMVDLLCNESAAQKYTITSHTLPISSLCIGPGIFREARLYIASLDATVSIVDIFTGKVLYTLAFDAPLHSLVLDPAERAVYAGSDKGVHMVPLYYESSDTKKLVAAGTADGGVVNTTDIERSFAQSRSKITALTVSPDGSSLYVGSDNGEASCWDVGSAQLMRKYKATKGAVTALILTEQPLSDELKVLPTLQRHVASNADMLDFVPHLPNAYSRSAAGQEPLDEVSESELSQIRKYAAGQADTPLAAAGAHEDAESTDAATELRDLQQRHEQLKKMYDALWARHTAK